MAVQAERSEAKALNVLKSSKAEVGSISVKIRMTLAISLDG
jgi:hypothetical protein